ncbi:MAG: hypothetical protein WD739_06220 [Actinomycetota bacterium]
MPAGRYAVLDGDGDPVGTEEFRCAPGPMGWRYFSEITTSDPTPHEEVVDLVTDAEHHPVRTRIHTGEHELLLQAEGDELRGFRDGERISIPWKPDRHLDYLSPSYNAVTGRRLDATAEIDVVYIEAVTLEVHDERQRYELLGDEEIDTPAGSFPARRWRYTSLSSGWSRDLWIAGDVVVGFDDLFVLEEYDPGASGVAPQP